MSSEDNHVQWPQAVVNNMPKHYNKQEFEDFLKKSSITFRKVKKVPQKTFGFVTFDTEDELNHALSEISKLTFKNFQLEAQKRTANIRDSNPSKRGRQDGDEGANKRARGEVKSAKEAVCPWWNVPYEEQLVRKTNAMKSDCLGPIYKEVKSSYTQWNRQKKREGAQQVEIPTWLTSATTAPEGLSYDLDLRPIVASPETTGYRNKCEFTFGYELVQEAASTDPPSAEEGAEPAEPTFVSSVGFRVSSFKDGVLVESPEDCPNVPDEMKLVVQKFTTLIRNHPELPVYDQHKHSGVWRLLTCRFSRRTNQMVLMLCVCLRGVVEEQWNAVEEEMSSLLTPLTQEGSQEPFVRGFCLQVYDGLSVPAADHPVKVVFGEDFITEKMNDCVFRISPQAFFQVNTPCAEILYAKVVEALRNDAVSGNEGGSRAVAAQNLLCLDVCCGTGTIGICCSKANLGIVVGVELCQAAVDDAHLNAKLNDLPLLLQGESSVPNASSEEVQTESGGDTGSVFVCSRAEAVLGGILGGGKPLQGSASALTDMIRNITILARGKKVLAVVDPPREGMHIECLRAIRNCSRIDRLVYVSCNPCKSLVKDCVTLCGPGSKKLFGAAFRPVEATPVDLFPMTPHCEMLLVLERCA